MQFYAVVSQHNEGIQVPDLITTSLPVLPLRSGVVFPHMVITVAIESEIARHALAATESTAGKLVLIPMVDGEYL